MKNSNKITNVWDFWYNNKNYKFYLIYEILEKDISVLKLLESDYLE